MIRARGVALAVILITGCPASDPPAPVDTPLPGSVEITLVEVERPTVSRGETSLIRWRSDADAIYAASIAGPKTILARGHARRNEPAEMAILADDLRPGANTIELAVADGRRSPSRLNVILTLDEVGPVDGGVPPMDAVGGDQGVPTDLPAPVDVAPDVVSLVHISSLSPASGSTSGGTEVTIQGDHFDSGVTVSFGGLPGTAVSRQNSRRLKATTPPWLDPITEPTAVSVTVTNPDGSSISLNSGFTYDPQGP